MCRALLLVLLCLVSVPFAGCGAEPAPPVGEPGPWSRDCGGKPAPAVGTLELVVVDRPASDRVVLEARWVRGPRGDAPAVDLVLPEGAWLVDGVRTQALRQSTAYGTLRWTVGFEPGVDLDVAARLRARGPDGGMARERCVRIANRMGNEAR